MSVLTDIKNRGVRDTFFLVCDGLKGLPEVVGNVWPRTTVQTCIIHLIRNTFKLVSKKDWDALKRDVEPIYTAPNPKAARAALEELTDADRLAVGSTEGSFAEVTLVCDAFSEGFQAAPSTSMYAPIMNFQNWVELAGRGIDAAGVAAVVIGTIAATIYAIVRFIRRQRPIYWPYRQFLGRSILLGLELLVAADIIRAVAITPILESVTVLAVIVLIRTFLSFSLELEITGR